MEYNKDKAHYITVTAIVIKDGKFLIAKRSPNEKIWPNLWTVPGGKMEVSDYTQRPKDTSEHWYNVFDDVVKREVKEEVGLEIRNLKYLTSIAFIRPDGIPSIIVSMYADHAGGDVILSDELVDHAWITMDEAKNYKFIEGIYEELVMLDAVLKGKQVEQWSKVE